MIEEDVMIRKEMKIKQIGIFFLILGLSVNLFAQNPREIVNKCVTALGGEAAVQNFANYQAKGTMKLAAQGMELSGKLETIQLGRKRWNRIELQFGGQTYILLNSYDGETAWMDRMGTIVDQPALNYESDLDHDITLLIEPEAKFSLGKESEIDGKKAVGIDVDFKGKKTTFYVNLDDYSILEMVYEDVYFGENYTKETLEKRVRFSDYKDISGVLFPTSMAFYQKGQKQMEFHLEEVSFNPQVADAKFQRPDQKLDLRYSEELIH
jgi:hypothetical protein